MTYLEKLQELLQSHIPFVAVTVVDTQGSAPQSPGAKMLVTARGLHYGTVGGGKIEQRAIEEALAMLHAKEGSERTKFIHWSLPRDLGMTCGGGIRLYFESYHFVAWNIVVFGAGHVAQALIDLLTKLDCNITCIDPRSEWLEKLPDSPRLKKIEAQDMVAETKNIPDDAFVVLMTMGHTTDKPILLELLRTGKAERLPYLGIIGSKAKAVQIKKDIAEAKLPDECNKLFFCPIGLNLGSNDPYEIAISTVAQLLQMRDAVFSA
jgi:xanthine dehydrogenase accessory factor